MSTWMMRRVSDYWDQPSGSSFEQGAIHRLSRLVVELPPVERPEALKDVERSVARHCQALDDHSLTLAAFTLADDLYRGATVLTYWDEYLKDYLDAVCSPFWAALRERGYSLQYGIDNAYQNSPTGMAGPLEWFPVWFGAAQVAYVCPQQAAVFLMESDGIDRALYHDRMEEYIREGREMARTAVTELHAERRNVVWLDTDATPGFLDEVTASFERPGVIGLVRTQPPTSGQDCALVLPPGPYPEGARIAGPSPSSRPGEHSVSENIDDTAPREDRRAPPSSRSPVPAPNVLAGVGIGLANPTWAATFLVSLAWPLLFCVYVGAFERERRDATVAHLAAKGNGNPVRTFYLVEAFTALATALPLAVVAHLIRSFVL